MLTPIAKFFLICFLGFIFSLSAPGYDLWFLAWIGLSPLFIIINTTKKIKDIIFHSFIFGFSYTISYINWLITIHPLNWLSFNTTESIIVSSLSLLITAFHNSLYFSIFALCMLFLNKSSVNLYNKGIFKLLITTLIWLVIFNKLSAMEVVLGFPWTLVEYSQYKNLYLIQIAEYFGSIAISFLIVFFNLIVADFFILITNIQKLGDRYVLKKPEQLTTVIQGLTLILTLIILSIIFGAYTYKKNQESFSNKSKTVCVIQGNLPIKATRGGSLDINTSKKTYSDLMKNIINTSTIFVLPEGALPTIFNFDPNTKNWIKTIAHKLDLDIIFGSYCKDKTMLTNCAISYSSIADKFSLYEKERLVPFGEFVPFSQAMPASLKKLAYNIIGNGFSKGRDTKPLNISGGAEKVGINICFELIYPEIIRKQSLLGANFFVNLSDLSWFSSDLIKQQFLAFGVFRAIENRKPLIIATNSGISAFIEPTGKIKGQSLSNTNGVLMDWVNLNKKTTFYAKYGW